MTSATLAKYMSVTLCSIGRFLPPDVFIDQTPNFGLLDPNSQLWM